MISANDIVHVLLELPSAILGLLIGVTALAIRTYSEAGKSSVRLVYWESFGAYCFLIGLLHVALSVLPISADFRFAGPASWFLNQVGFVALVALVWIRPERLRKSVGGFVGAAVAGTIALTVMRGRYYYDAEIGRPAELILAAFIFPLLVLLYRTPRQPFQTCLFLAALIFLVQQIVMAFSTEIHDAPFWIAHALQVATMFSAYIGLIKFRPGVDG